MRLVNDVADCRVGRPDTVLIVGDAYVDSDVRQARRALRVGLPVLLCLPEQEIRALVAHELAALDPRQPELVARVVRCGHWQPTPWPCRG
jgi:hypothetical protein